MKFFRFMASPLGRAFRVSVGLAFLGIGVYYHGGLSTVLAGIGLIPIMAGLLNWCLLAPFFGLPLAGAAIGTPRRCG